MGTDCGRAASSGKTLKEAVQFIAQQLLDRLCHSESKNRMYDHPNNPVILSKPYAVNMEGGVAIPVNGLGVPLAVQQPGGTVVWSTGAQDVKVYAEGVSIVSGDSPTHDLIPGEIATNEFTLEAYVNTNRVSEGAQVFTLRLYDAEGAPRTGLGTGKQCRYITGWEDTGYAGSCYRPC
jgi:hypothetical protein